MPTISDPTWDMMYKGGFEKGFKAGINGSPSIWVQLYAFINYAVAEENWATFYYARGMQDGLSVGKEAREHYK